MSTDDSKRAKKRLSPERREPLPDSAPKSPLDDPEAPARLRRILEGPAYVRADRDLAFLARDDVRGVRLEVEYLKPELALEAYGIRSTIVLFGGTRICEPVAARRQVEFTRLALERDPQNTALRRRMRVVERILANSRYYDVAREFARMVSLAARERAPGEFVIVTGGGPGIMEAANRGAFDVGAISVGFNITLPLEQYPNVYITPDLCFQFRYFGLRKLHFMKRAKALIAFPGGYGTLDELFEALCLVQTRKIDPIPIILVGEEFWRRLVDIDFLAQEGVIAQEDVELFSIVDTVPEICGVLESWYDALDLCGPGPFA